MDVLFKMTVDLVRDRAVYSNENNQMNLEIITEKFQLLPQIFHDTDFLNGVGEIENGINHQLVLFSA